MLKPQGFAGLILPDDAVPLTPNQVQFGYHEAVCRLLSDPVSPYAARMMYVEYKNVASPGSTVTPPTGFSVNDGVEYYAGLGLIAGVDYLRIPIQGNRLLLVDGYAGKTVNAVNFDAYASAGVGVHGRPFNAGSNSLIYGVALVASPLPENPSADLILGRKYFTAQDQRICPASGATIIPYRLIP